jgi:DNA-binding phage protein
MEESTLLSLLADLTARARALGLTDTAWAARAGMPKETLSRLRRRSSCDLATLLALADAAGARLRVDEAANSPADGHVPSTLTRDGEERLVALSASRDLNPTIWRASGPPFFMAGLCVLLAGTRGFDRRALLSLAEELHPGASEPAVFQRWLDSTPIEASRFLPMVAARRTRAA